MFTQGFPPAPAPCRRTMFSCSGATFLFFKHVKRVCTDSAQRGRQKGPTRASRGLKMTPLITRYSRVSLLFQRIRLHDMNIIKQGPPSVFFDGTRAPVCLQKGSQITRCSQVSLIFHRSILNNMNIIKQCLPSVFLNRVKAKRALRSPDALRFL